MEIRDAKGRALQQKGFSNAEVALEMGNPGGEATYYLTLIPGFAAKSPQAFQIEIREDYLSEKTIPIQVGGVRLAPYVPTTLTFTLGGVPAPVPQGFQSLGQILFRDGAENQLRGFVPVRFDVELPRPPLAWGSGSSPGGRMTWATGLATGRASLELLSRALAGAEERLGEAPDLLLLFTTVPGLLSQAGKLPGLGRIRIVAGCAPRALWCPGRGWVQAPIAMALAAHLPGVKIHPCHFRAGVLAGPDDPPQAWRRALGLGRTSPAGLLLLATRESAHLAPLLPGLTMALPGLPCLGAVAGTDRARPAIGELFLTGAIPAVDAIGLTFEGNLNVEVTSIGSWSPLGPARRVTSLQGPELGTLEGLPAAEALRQDAGPGADQLARGLDVLVEVGSQPPDASGNLPLPLVRTALLVGGRMRILAPEETRIGQWVRFCRADPAQGARRAREVLEALSPPQPGEGCLVLSGQAPGPSPAGIDPVEILLQGLGNTPAAALLTTGQIASVPPLGPRLLGQSLVLAGSNRLEGPDQGHQDQIDQEAERLQRKPDHQEVPVPIPPHPID